MRRANRDGALAAPVLVAASSAERASGFPRMVPDASGRLVFAWTDVSGGARSCASRARVSTRCRDDGNPPSRRGGCARAGRVAGPTPGLRVGTRAPELLTTSLAGDTVALSSFEGAPVLLNLWATWCAPCRRETPYLQTLHERYAGQGLRVVGVTVDTRGAASAVRDFIGEFGVTYTILSDPDMVSMDRYAVIGLPATFLLDRGGVIRHMVTGPVAEGDARFEAALQAVLP